MSWRIVKLGDLVENFSVRAKDYGGSEGLDFCGVSNEEGIIKTKYAAEDKAEDYKIIEKGCFAYNPYRVNVGSIGLVTDDFKGLISPAYVVFKPKPKTIIPELLFKFLKSDEGLRQIRFYGRGTVRQALRFEDLCNIELSLPDYSEQEKLFKKLINSQEKSNILSTELTHQLDLVKKLRQQFLQDAVRGKLVPQNSNDEPASELLKKIKAEKQKLIAEGKLKKEKELPSIKAEEIPFKIPESWVWCRLGEIILSAKDGPHFSPKYSEVGIPFISTRNISTNGIDFSTAKYISQEYHNEISKRCKPEKGDVLYTKGGTTGIATVNTYDIEFNVWVHVAVLKMTQFIDSFYLKFALNTPHCYKQSQDLTRGISNQDLGLTRMITITIPLPPLAEQHRIVQKLNELMQTCETLEASIKESAEQNEKLLQQVLREALRKEEVGA